MISNAIILAGGKGTRIGPGSLSTSKHLIQVYDKPIIFFTISFLLKIGVTNLIIIVNPDDKKSYIKLLGNGKSFGIKIKYINQKKPNGIPEAFKISSKLIYNKNVLLILGDNFLYPKNNNLIVLKRKINNFKNGSTIFTVKVKDVSSYGAIRIKKQKITIKEKPNNSFSKNAIIGLYLFDKNVTKYAKKLKKSKRGEFEITDLLDIYLQKKLLDVCKISKQNFFWMDLGSIKSIIKAQKIVLKNYNNLKDANGYLEYIALENKLITKKMALKRLVRYGKNEYTDKIFKLINLKKKNGF